MKLRVLGCSGGIGGTDRTTSFLLDDDVLIDAGSGVMDLSVDELARIDHVFLTHSHLDHILSLPLMVDSVGSLRERPLVVHALPETIAALEAHIFNWVIWPDFTKIPHPDQPSMRFEPLAEGAVLSMPGQRTVRALPANHTVPALGYQIACERGSIVFSGDTSPDDAFWNIVNAIPDLHTLIIETAFANRDQDLAVLAKHLFPIQLARELDRFTRHAQVWITHLKPSDHALIAREVETWAGRHAPRILGAGTVIEI